MITEGGFKQKSDVTSEIPDSSLADIAFLLLIFFMVSTTFRQEEQLEITIPEAEATQQLETPREDILHVWVEPDGQVYINDKQIPRSQISGVVAPLYRESDRQLVVVIKADANVPYLYIDQVQKELQQARAVRVVFYTDLEQQLTRARR